MIDSTIYAPFNPGTVALEGTNLIEASAGTGKTYSIGILAIRLLIEKELPLQEILMVTFTKAATAELELRIREFVKKAYKVSQGEEINDSLILEIVQNTMQTKGREKVFNLLENAIYALDEVHIVTIHSFCQGALNEFSIETKQLFKAEVVTDRDSLIAPFMYEFWRKHVTTLHPKLLQEIWDKNIFNDIFELVKKYFSGTEYYNYDAHIQYHFDSEEQQKHIESIQAAGNKLIEAKEQYEAFWRTNLESIRKACERKSPAKKLLQTLIENPFKLIDKYTDKKKSNYIEDVFRPLVVLDKIDDILSEEQALEKVKKGIKNNLYCFAIQEIKQAVRNHTQLQNILTYDDFIKNLHQAIVQPQNDSLIRNLRKKYKAVFIDEFQDTDRIQYEIFKATFHQNTILFYIGDPKQSIYGWRGADIFTYLKAATDVKSKYSMNINYRSSDQYISALNEFLLPTEDFDTFYFDGAKDFDKNEVPPDNATNKIKYHRVNSPTPNKAGKLLKGNEDAAGIFIANNFQNINERHDCLVKQITELLTNEDFQILAGERKRKIRPSDIAVLVRTNKEAESIRKKLNRQGVPTITYKEEKILKSEEAKGILYLLEAFLSNKVGKIGKALSSSIGTFSDEDILKINLETISSAFQNYRSTWESKGIYAALIQFVLEFDIKTRLTENDPSNKERILTNIYHLIEILHKIQHQNHFTPAELTQWLKRSTEANVEGDEYNQRLESEEEAVRLLTIHNSKGLQFNIILIPNLDWEAGGKETLNFREEKDSTLKYGNKKDLDEVLLNLGKTQDEQENRRLLYVALTRAIYACYLYKAKNNLASTLGTFYTQIRENSKYVHKIPQIENDKKYEPEKIRIVHKTSMVHFALHNDDWKQLSYSRLSIDANTKRKEAFVHSDDEYDQFIFKELSHGNITGNFLHLIFENLVFNDPKKWESVVNRAVIRIASDKQKLYTHGIKQLIEHMMYAQICTPSGNFTLSEIDSSKKMHELDFDFPIHQFDSSMLANDLFEEKLRAYNYKASSGIMNGKIDLVFEWNGKYFILDWKSNYLGYNLEDYDSDHLQAAMDENNYHLQYYIYSLALKKYLAFRLPDFDYEKHFGGVIYCFIRGMRNGETSGIYFKRPTEKQMETLFVAQSTI